MLFGAELAGVVLGLAAAVTYGAGDFSGGLATKRNNVILVIVLSQAVGLALVLLLAVTTDAARPPLQDMLFGAAAGISGALGLIGLYRGLASGKMGVVAPLTAITTATVPLIAGSLLEGLPELHQLAGFGLALSAVWLLAYAGPASPTGWRELLLPLLAGTGFGLYFIFTDLASERAVLWPLVAARLASVSFMLLVVLAGRTTRPLQTRQLPLIALAGLLDITGNGLFALATRFGRLDIAAVLASLYPAATVVLAWLILHEQLSPRQRWGAAAALTAVALLTS